MGCCFLLVVPRKGNTKVSVIYLVVTPRACARGKVIGSVGVVVVVVVIVDTKIA